MDTCLNIAYNIFFGDIDLESYFRDSVIVDTCIEVACSTLASSETKYRAWRVISLALPFRVFRSRASNATQVDGMVKSLLSLMSREVNISDQATLFTSIAYLIFHLIMLRYNDDGSWPPSEAITSIIGSDSFLTRCSNGLGNVSSSRPYLFALHSLACFPEASVQTMLHARLRDSSLFQKLCDICSSGARDDVLEMAVLAVGSLIGCKAYFPHLAAQVSERLEIKKIELSEEERIDLVLAEQAAVRDQSERMRNIPLTATKDAVKRVVDKALIQLLQGTAGLQTSVALLRLLTNLCKDVDYARKLASPHAASSQSILSFASVIVTLVMNLLLSYFR